MKGYIKIEHYNALQEKYNDLRKLLFDAAKVAEKLESRGEPSPQISKAKQRELKMKRILESGSRPKKKDILN